MKKLLLLLGIAAIKDVQGQTPFSTRDSLNINNINAMVLTHGDMWYDPTTYEHGCFYKNGTRKNVGFAAAIWVSGYDAGGQLHIAAQTYRQDGNDYWPGPLDGADTLTYNESKKWAKIWKVNRTDVNTFLASSTHTEATTPAAILKWPAKQSAYARGANDSVLTITSDMAPFVDVNSNGIYEPLLGDYPDFAGDQALWWVYSDNGPTHTESKGQPLKIEVHAMATGYHRGNALDDIVYYQYKVVNKSATNYTNVRLAQWDDGDLGYFMDDYIGFDSARRMGVYFNANNDDGASAGYPAGSYGPNPPIRGLTIVKAPGDGGGSYAPVGSFMFYNNDMTPMGNPQIDTEFNYYMRSSFRYGMHLRYDASTGSMTTGDLRNYVFSDGPEVAGGWNECTMSDVPGDRRFILSSGDETLVAGGSLEWVLAMVVDSAGGGCPSASFGGVRNLADTAWYYHYNPPATLDVHNAVVNNGVRMYPNPVADVLHIDQAGNKAIGLRLYDMAGKLVVNTTLKAGDAQVDVRMLPSGLYVAEIVVDGSVQRQLIAKQ